MMAGKYIRLICFICFVWAVYMIVASWLNVVQSETTGEKHKECLQTRDQTTNIDMVNCYYPYLNFSLHFPVVVPARKSQEHVLIVFVTSAARGEKYRERRALIRQTWGSYNTCERQNMMRNKKLAKLKWSLVFVLAKAGTNDDERNMEEARKYNDMLIGNFPDRYVNLILKFYMAQLWAASLTPVPQYTLKVDDDVYVRIPKVVQYLSEVGFPKRFYGGHTYHAHTVDRTPHGRWALSWKYYAEKQFPAINVGPFILLSTDLLPHLFNYVKVRKPFYLEDAYIGVAMKDGQVKVSNIASMASYTVPNITRVIRDRSDCETWHWIGVGHYLEIQTSLYLHNRIETMCATNMTLSSTACRFEYVFSYFNFASAAVAVLVFLCVCAVKFVCRSVRWRKH